MTFTDDGWLTAGDIKEEDPKLVNDVIPSEGIRLSVQISRAIDEVGSQILNDMKSFSFLGGADGVTSAHNQAVMLGTGSMPRNRIALQQVVVDPQDGQFMAPIRLWAVHEVILRCYRAALNNNLTDRYVARVDSEEKLIYNRYRARYFNDGVPIVFQPLSRPGATRDFYNTGTWVQDSNVVAVAGSGAGGDFDVALTYVDQGGSNSYVSYSSPGNAESAPSEILRVTCAANQNISASIASLNPPTGVPPAELTGVYIPRKASGWNVYCGAAGSGVMRLQNPTPIPIATTSFAFAPVAGYALMGTGQRREQKAVVYDRSLRV
ncbi:MAG TPA: hypothetical protein VNH18_25265 [Bryobacteraceae bacterium]|nr:hypothetical protein [Bryobacteraceae bacterium]